MLSTTTYAYDALNHLLDTSWTPAVAQTAPTASSATFAYGYNAANQRISQTASDNSYWSYPAATPATVAYTANDLDQYSAVGSVMPTYDGNGNLTYDGTFTYGYDAESRLISASGAGNTASYAYDPQGRRKEKTVNGTTTLYVQDPQSRALLDYSGSTGAIQDWYAFGLGPNDALNQINVASSTRATYVPDIQGSIVASLDAASGALTKAGFQPYGESASTAGTFRYTGARIDAETNGLYDFRARMYAPGLGRFMQTDPAGTNGGVNLYIYVGNDPLDLVDVFGLAPDAPGGGGTWASVGAFFAAVGSDAIAAYDAIRINPETSLTDSSAGAAISAGTFLQALPFFVPGVSAPYEAAVVNEARIMVTSPEMMELAQSYAAGESATVTIGGRAIQYEPNLPASGMTMFGENGFLMGPMAFQSNLEQNATVLQELYRLTFSESASGVSGELATSETLAAYGFANANAWRLP